jgi:hypothetical protein
MAAYDICYLDQSGTLTCKFIAMCDGDKVAKILAHAMKLPNSKSLEVWNGEMLVYRRAQNAH